MHRRAYIRALGTSVTVGLASIAGCSSEPSVASEGVLTSVVDIPSKIDIRPTVEVLSDEYTEQSPVRVRVKLKNVGSDRRILSHAPLGLPERLSTNSELWLCTQAVFLENRTDPDRWTINRLSGDIPLSASSLVSFDENSHVGGEFMLVDNANEPGYLEPGNYQWDTRLGVAPEGPVPIAPNSADTTYFDWGFSIKLI